MSGFFFFLCFFSCLFLSRKNCSSPSSLSSSFLSSSFSRNSLFWGWEKEEKKYISRKKRAFSFREREEYSHHHLRSRGTEGKETLAVITSSFSLFVVVVLFVSRRGTKCVISLWKKGVLEYFRDDRPKEKEVRKSEKEGGADSAETAQSPKGEKRFKTLVSTQNYL